MHASGRNSFLGLSALIAKLVQKRLKEIDHILVSSQQFVRKLRAVPFSNNLRFAKFDIKHFFMTGKPTVLASLTASLFEDSAMRTLVHDTVLFLLDNQYLKTHDDNDHST